MFDSAASIYEAARPSYPAELFDDLVELAELKPGDRLLEIGCATGKATRSLLERGSSIVCVEMGAQLAERARGSLAGFPVEIHVVPFESWEAKQRAFDLVYAATAWHWVDPEIRYRKAHQLLRHGGHLAFWSASHAFPPGFDPFFEAIQGSTTQSARAIRANGRRLRLMRSRTTAPRSKPAVSLPTSRSDATSGRRCTRPTTTSPS
jgi:SAM-dependent methyltransferase